MSVGVEFSTRFLEYFSHLPSFYEASWPLVDALVFVLIFVGLARAAFEKRFAGQGGKALIVGIGLSLAIGMVWAEVEYGFSIKSFGPMAAGLVLLLLLSMLFQVGRAMGISRLGSVALTGFLGLPLAAQLVPDLVSLAAQVLPLILLVWVASGVLTGRSALRISPFSFKRSAETELPQFGLSGKEAHSLKHLDHDEKREIRSALRESKRVIQHLKRIRRELSQQGLSPENSERIEADLQKLLQSEHEMVRDLARLHQTAEKLRGTDQTVLDETRVRLRVRRDPQTRETEEETDRLRRELSLQEAIDSMRVRCEQYDKAFSQSIRQAIATLRVRRTPESLRWVEHALHWETKALHILEDIRHLYRKAHELLRRTTGKQLR